MVNLCKLYIIALFATIISCGVTKHINSSQFRVIMEWKMLNFSWPNNETYNTALNEKTYVPKNCLISGVKYYDGFYYLTLPRMKSGIPATLTRISANGDNVSPNLTPYPSWKMNTLDDCDALQNTQNIEIDSHGKMWILDGGRTSTLSMKHGVNKCPPKLIIIDVDNDKLIRTFVFPSEVTGSNKSFIYDIVIDESLDGDFAYITDNSMVDPGIIVYSFKENRAWKLRDDKSMKADPKATEFRVNDVPISTPINIAGIALSPKTQNGKNSLTINIDGQVFYCPLSSYHLYNISTLILKNESLVSVTKDYSKFIKDVGIKASQTDGMIMDNQGTLYYGLLSSSSISKWNIQTPFASGQKVVAHDPKYIMWPNSFTFDTNGNLIVLTNNLQKYVFDSLSIEEVNFRLLISHTQTNSYLYADNNLEYEHKRNEDNTKNEKSEDNPTILSTSSTSSITATTTTINQSTSQEDEEDPELSSTTDEQENESGLSNESSSSSTTEETETSSSERSSTYFSAIIPDSTSASIESTSTSEPTTENQSFSKFSTTTEKNDQIAGETRSDSESLPFVPKTTQTSSTITTASITEEVGSNTPSASVHPRSSSDYSKLGFTVIILAITAYLGH